MKRVYLALVAFCFSIMAIAQEGAADINVDVEETGGAGSFPWLWIVGGIVFIILLIALLGGSSRRDSDRVVERKTIIKE